MRATRNTRGSGTATPRATRACAPQSPRMSRPPVASGVHRTGRPRRGRTSRAGPLRAPAARPGDPAWIEEPGYAGARAALLGAGARIEPVPVDAEGLDVAAGEARCPGARLAYITPSCQFPLGATLSLERRLRLLDWAERAGAFVIEDDYDSEYRYRGRPITALQGIDDNGRVAYVGTFSKTMFPAVRVGYIIAPRDWRRPLPTRSGTPASPCRNGTGGTRRVHRRRPLRQACAPDADAVRKASRAPLRAGPRAPVGCDGARPLRSRHAGRRLARRWTG